MRGWRRARAKVKTFDADGETPLDAQPDIPVEVPVDIPVEALIVMTDEPGPPFVAPAESQNDILRLLDVVTNMCDHVIEYIEADRAERRLMLETLAQLGHVISDGAATIAAASARALAAPVPTPVPTAVEVPTHAPVDTSTALAAHERVIGGSMPAGPGGPVIDLVKAEQEPEFAALPAATSTSMEIAVEVRGRFGDRWVDGFEICEVMTTPDGPRYRLRRNRDGVVLPELFDATNIRHVETFEELAGTVLAPQPNGNHHVNGSTGYWSRS